MLTAAPAVVMIVAAVSLATTAAAAIFEPAHKSRTQNYYVSAFNYCIKNYIAIILYNRPFPPEPSSEALSWGQFPVTGTHQIRCQFGQALQCSPDIQTYLGQ